MKKFLIPIVLFALLGGLLYYGLRLDPRMIPSPLIGKPVPTFTLPTVDDPNKKVSNSEFHGQVYLINVWASWCTACREEHPVINELVKRDPVTIIGLNYKDQRPDALAWLRNLGDPYKLSLFDGDGRLGIDLGVYGVPETFVVDKQGIIRYKQIGPITPEVWSQKLMPLIRQLS
jgi:cytochrome c biogenesis protein CcmG, thiol:disulfide interchange protein DsbE